MPRLQYSAPGGFALTGFSGQGRFGPLFKAKRSRAELQLCKVKSGRDETMKAVYEFGQEEHQI